MKEICCNGGEEPGKRLVDDFRRNVFGNQEMSVTWYIMTSRCVSSSHKILVVSLSFYKCTVAKTSCRSNNTHTNKLVYPYSLREKDWV